MGQLELYNAGWAMAFTTDNTYRLYTDMGKAGMYMPWVVLEFYVVRE